MQDTMKVAIFEPWPRVCGVTTWAFELVHGFRALGHQADIVSCTKSGRARATQTAEGGPRNGWQWWDTAADKTFTWAEAPRRLDAYDLIILNEPKNNPLDGPARSALKRAKNPIPDALPEYIDVLRRTKTPWITAFHDKVAYRPDKAPFLTECMSAGQFAGLAIQCRPGSYESASYAAGNRVTKLLSWPWLPYTSKRERANWRPLRERPLTISMTGRMTSNKGFTSLLAVADQITPPYEVRFHGSDSGGMAPTTTFKWYEALVMYHGWKGLRGDPTVIAERTEHSIKIGNWAPTTSNAPYGMRHPVTGAVYRYMGPYADRIRLYDDIRITLMLSRKDLATSLEYSALEALDAGCVLIAPKYVVSDMRGADYDIVWIDYDRGVSKPTEGGFRWPVPAEREALLAGVRRAAELVETYDPAENYRKLDMYHHPRHLAGAILDAL